jgi:TRAP-type C4-dicarboxylate transport system permease small subunit
MPEPAKLKKPWDAALDAINDGVEMLMSVVMIGSVVVVLFQVVMRLIGHPGPTIWVNEAIMIGNVWLTYVGGAVLARKDEHLALYAYEWFPPAVRTACLHLARLVVLVTSLLVVFYGCRLVARQLQTYYVTLPGVPRGVGSVSIVIGFALTAAYKISDIVARRNAAERQEPEEVI